MAKSKIDEERAQELLKIVRFVLDNHEWCEYPSIMRECGQHHHDLCDMRDDGRLCDGCKMRNKAENVAKWRAAHD